MNHKPPAITGRCPQCGALIPPDAPEGLCPACVAKRILEVNAPAPAPSVHASSVPSAADLAPLVTGYEVIELIGVGGMGAVYKARHAQLDRIVALKLLPIDPASADPEFAERFRREARAMARLSHPNIVAVHDFGETSDGRFFLVMEFIEGTNLHTLIHSGGVTPDQALAIIPQICAGLQCAHEHGIVHRDIKPANILIDTNGTVKITDFGLAKIIGGEQAAAYTLTLDERTIGTPDYMAPEQFKHGSSVDHRADIYSLGVLLYELLTGQVPKGVFDPPSKKVQIDVRFDEIVLRAMQSQPERRFQHVSEIKTRVEEVSDRSKAPVEMCPARWPGIAAAVLILATIAGFGLWWWTPWKKTTDAETPRHANTVSGTHQVRATWHAKMAEAGNAYDTNRFDEALRLYQEVDTLLKEAPGIDAAVLAAARARVADRLELIPWIIERAKLPAEQQIERTHLLLKKHNTGLGPRKPGRFELSNRLMIVEGGEVRDLSPLKGLPLAEADIAAQNLEDLSPLGGAPLKRIDLSWSVKVKDLGPLAGMRLEQLDITRTDVTDISPLKGMPLKMLIMGNSRLADVSPLAHMRSLQHCFGWESAMLAPVGEALAAGDMAKARVAADHIVAQFGDVPAFGPLCGGIHASLDACETLKADPAASPPAVKTHDGHRYLWVPAAMSWHSARRYAEQLGGHLATINNPAEREFICDGDTNMVTIRCMPKTVKFLSRFWLGAYGEAPKGGRQLTWRWVTGETWDPSAEEFVPREYFESLAMNWSATESRRFFYWNAEKDRLPFVVEWDE